jgi:beta-lactamase class A
MTFSRRGILALTVSGFSAQRVGIGRAAAPDGPARVRAAVDRFARLPATSSGLVVAEHPITPWEVAHDPAARLFVGSAIKTFILAQFLRDVEAGRLSEESQLKIDDTVRSLGSPVFLHLSGTTSARIVLEAMIAHSDNTATDVALAATGPAQVRALISRAGLKQTQVPHSTRRLFSYLAGAPEGADLGWEDMQRVANGGLAGTPRRPLNDSETMVSTAEEMVRWYQQALRGAFFEKPATFIEFKRIQGMAGVIAMVMPPDTVAYAKGGSIDWQDFHCLCVAGQMIVATVPITFCLTINWTGPDDGVATMTQSYMAAAADVLRGAAQAVVQ